MKIAIVGTGGVGGYFGGKLAKAGYDVTFLARGEHLKAIQQKGLSIESIHGDFHVNQAKATDRIQAIGLADLVIIAVKAWQVRDVGKELNSLLKSETLILPLQNGISAADELSELIHPQHIIGGLCRIISKIKSPGVISHFGMEPELVFGELTHAQTERAMKIKAILDSAGIKSHISADIQADLWKKFIAICVSGLLAVSRTTYGELRGLKETRVLMVELLNEIYQLSQKIGIKIDPDYINRTVALVDSFPFESTSSLTRDVWEGKPSEIEYQNGTVVRLAEKHGIDVPVNRFVYHCILPMEMKARNQ